MLTYLELRWLTGGYVADRPLRLECQELDLIAFDWHCLLIWPMIPTRHHVV